MFECVSLWLQGGDLVRVTDLATESYWFDFPWPSLRPMIMRYGENTSVTEALEGVLME